MQKSHEEYRAELIAEHIGYGFTQKEAEIIADTGIAAANAASSTIGDRIRPLSQDSSLNDACCLYALRVAYRLEGARSQHAVSDIELFVGGAITAEDIENRPAGSQPH